MNKIHGEHTRLTHLPPLCDTCSAATIVRGTRFGDDVVRCHALGRVTFHVTECNAYSDARLVPVYRLEETAWRWFDNRFVSPAELMRLHQVSAPTPASQGLGAVTNEVFAVDPGAAERPPEAIRAGELETEGNGTID